MLGGNKRKPAPVLKKAVVVEAVEELPRPMFRGFIGGDAFITKKGYRGLRLDSLWVQNIFESFRTDDHELAAIALKSAIADVNDRVCGGVCGSPFSIGDYGFYAQTQFEPQMKFLQEKIQGIALQAKVYLSGSEWEEVEKKLLVLVNHGYATFSRVAPGDSFAALAIRLSAFQVAKTLMNAGIDPLVENSEGKDMFDVMKEQYKELSTRLKETQDLKETAMRRIMVPTAVEHILSEECKLLDNFHFLSEFSDDLKVNLENRIVEINKDKILQRRAMLREEAFPDQKVWNIAQLDKAERYLQEIIELKGYIVEKIHFHEIHAVEFESLATVLIANYKLLQQKDDRSVTSNSIASAEMDSTTPGNSRGTARRGSVMSRQSLASGLSSLQRDPSVISLKGDDESDHTPRVGFAFDDTSVLTEENPPSRIPVLPHIPNRLKNSCIDGRRTVMQMRARKQKFVPVVEAPPDALAMLLKSEGRVDTRVTADVLSPRTAGSKLVSPRSGPESATKLPALGALVIRPDSTATGKSHTDTPNQTMHESSQSHHRRHNASSGIASPSSRVGFDLSSRPNTADSERFSHRPGTADSFDSQFNDSSKPGTPSQKMRQSRSDKVVSKLSSKQELYEALGVADEEEESSVSSPVSRGGRSNTSAKQNIVPMTSAKLLAKSLRDEYAPVLGTFRQTENEVIMYR